MASLLTKHRARSNTGDVPATAVGSLNMLNPGQTATPIPLPATAYVRSNAPLSNPYRPESGATIRSRSAVTSRKDLMWGILNQDIHGGVNQAEGMPMIRTGGVRSTSYQPTLIGQIKFWTNNLYWYICYPAASVMQGGMHNLALSERTDQLKTIPTAGPGSAAMQSKPQWTKVQHIPRYSAVPATYNTTSSPA